MGAISKRTLSEIGCVGGGGGGGGGGVSACIGKMEKQLLTPHLANS